MWETREIQLIGEGTKVSNMVITVLILFGVSNKEKMYYSFT